MEENSALSEEAAGQLAVFLQSPISRFEVIQLLTPVRSSILILVGTLIDAVGVLRVVAEDDAAAHEKAEKAWGKLGEVFEELDKYSSRMDELLSVGKASNASAEALDE